MKILLTNDDGIFSPGLKALYEKIKEKEKVIVVAPESERSAASHSLTLHKPLRVNKIKYFTDSECYTTNGTPTDCIVLAINAICKDNKPDLVISGINNGANIGGDLTYSGTVSAAMEATILGVPAFAISITSWNPKHLVTASTFAVKLTEILKKNKLKKGTFLNVNVPDLPLNKLKGVAITCQSSNGYQGVLEKRKDLRGKFYYWVGGKPPQIDKSKNSDLAAIREKKISVTPVKLELTDYEFLKELKKWKLQNLFHNI